MLRSCKYCGRIHERNYKCEKRPKYKRPENDIVRFRQSNKWTEASIRMRERDNYLCLVCQSNGKYNYEDVSVHHIVPLSEDWDKRLDEDNLITLCGRHHEEAESGKLLRKDLVALLVPPEW